jgi:EF-P beta-lysylation protein EpmB
VVRCETSWQEELTHAARTPQDLLQQVGLDARDIPDLDCQSSTFRTLATASYIRRMQPADPHDPLLRQVLPLKQENLTQDGFSSDAVNDHDARRTPGLLQKYQGRALLIATGICAIHCRYCFRRDYPYAEEPRRLEDWQPAIDTLKSDTSITEVILSGGDPWMLNDHRLSQLCQSIDQIPHIERIRFHTRLPIVLPSRITTGLIQLLRSLSSQPVIVVHANHANEIVQDCKAALQHLVHSGVPVLNQAVLLNGINNTAQALEDLSRSLVNVGVMPYYLHQLDRVSGTGHFEVSDSDAHSLIQELETRLPGYAVPRLVREIPGQPSKTRL